MNKSDMDKNPYHFLYKNLCKELGNPLIYQGDWRYNQSNMHFW